jgi:hypothetical protein
MTPIDYVKRFTAVCNQYSHQPSIVWAHCGEEEHQVLCDNEGEEWDWFEICLTLWQRPTMVWDQVNTALPAISCESCCHYTKYRIKHTKAEILLQTWEQRNKRTHEEWCDKHNKAIPVTFNKNNACKGWNL